ncbi:MAG TPA: hypothetical protein VN541_17855, partial [Tepidisphaeraceae bacterium]|nr:hypothetical protein [Tepidisphaeraceae bacterium]
SLMSSPSANMEQWLTGHPKLWHRLIIPAELKWEIRDKLDQANVTERVLYPGLDGLSRWLRRYYSPRVDLKPEPTPGNQHRPAGGAPQPGQEYPSKVEQEAQVPGPRKRPQ